MPPSRREVLQSITAAVPVGLAGCMAGGASQTTDPSPSTSPTAFPAPTSTPPVTPKTPPEDSGGLDEFNPSNTHKRIEIGSRDGVKEEFKPHDLRIWNALGSEETIFVRILDRLAETTVHRAEYSIPTDEAVRIT